MLTVSVSGMTCQGCVRSVTNAVQKAAPEARVGVDLEAGLVTVDGPADQTAVTGAIDDAGFDVTEVREG